MTQAPNQPFAQEAYPPGSPPAPEPTPDDEGGFQDFTDNIRFLHQAKDMIPMWVRPEALTKLEPLIQKGLVIPHPDVSNLIK